MHSLVFTQESISRLSRFGISDEWFNNYELPPGTHGLKKVVVGNCIYIIEKDLDDDNVPVIVIKIDGEDAVFGDGLPNSMALDRIVTVSSSQFYSSVHIPSSWKPFSENSMLSFFASNTFKGSGARIHLSIKVANSSDLFFFSRTKSTTNFSEIGTPIDIYTHAKKHLAEAILIQAHQPTENNSAGIVLCEKLPHGFVQGASLNDWMSKKLTKEQLQFVNAPYSGPVRLRGAAGTGKTIAMIIKMISDALRFCEKGEDKRLCFITHNQGSVDLINAVIEELVPIKKRTELSSGNKLFEVRTIYDIANDFLKISLKDLTPVSLDGFEGRKFQYELIVIALELAWKSNVTRARFMGMDEKLMARWRQSAKGKDSRFIAELMNEFSSVIDSENIRIGEESAEEYLKRNRRPNWLLSLPARVDRQFILEIHSIYRKQLIEMNAFSIDEMIADFSAFLDLNVWNRSKNEEGFDAIFVDELHLFTALEKQTLQKMIRRGKDQDGKPERPSIFMAYDLKQSPRDSFLDYFAADGNIFSAKSGLQNSQLVELKQVFRYTPQIADFLKDLDAAFPAIDIPGEWGAYIGEPELPNKEKPILFRYPDDLTLLECIFAEAKRIAEKVKGGGRRVAVLCVSEDAFETYQPPIRGRFKDSTFLIQSRESAIDTRHIGKKFIFSMPEFVAGLQFDTVFLIHVNQSGAPESSGIGLRRQFISNTYLGASRAENQLLIASCEKRGGPSSILTMALERNSLLEHKIN